MGRLRVWTTVAGTALLLAAYGASLRAASGGRAPDVDMRDANNVRIHLTDFRGKVVLLDLWASWCKPCETSFPALDSLYREYRGRGMEVVAVNLDERRKNADTFLKLHPHEMLVVFDPRARVMRAFGAPGIPSWYLIDRQGTIRHSHIGNPVDSIDDYRRELEAVFAEPAR